MGKLAHKTTIFFNVNTIQGCLRAFGVLGLNNLVNCAFYKLLAYNNLCHQFDYKIYWNKLKRTCFNKLY